MLTWLLGQLNYEDIRFHDYGESDRPIFKGIELHGKLRRMNGYPSVWIVEASRGTSRIGPNPVMMAFLKQEFLRQVRGGH